MSSSTPSIINIDELRSMNPEQIEKMIRNVDDEMLPRILDSVGEHRVDVAWSRKGRQAFFQAWADRIAFSARREIPEHYR